jgi:lysine 2,3-aminomutase
LSKAGIVLGSHTVLLRGVNDDPKAMMKLMHELLKARVRPYYIYMADQVAGGEHFRTMVQTGLEIMQALRGWTSGLAIPYFVIDSPGGGGKVPLLREYVESMDDDEVVFRNYQGDIYRYKQPNILKDGCGMPAPDVVPIEIAKKPAGSPKSMRKRSVGP